MGNKWTRVGLVSLAALLVMALGAMIVFAQDEASPDGAPETPAMPFARHGFHGRFHDNDRGAGYDQALADALGISVEELQAARQKVAADRLAEAVENGRLTQDEANRLLARQALQGYLDRGTIMAQALGLTVEELRAAHEDGTLRDILANITPAELQANIREAAEAAVNRAVADNVITREQADLVLEQLQDGLDLGGRFGGHRGFHKFHGFDGPPRMDESGDAMQPFAPFGKADAFGA